MRGYGHLTRAFLLSQLREPVGFFFLLILSPMLLIILGLIFGNDPNPAFGNRGFIDNMLPGLTIMSILILGVSSAPLNQVMLRSTGALTRLRATPLKARTYVAADLTVNFALGLIGAIVTLLLGIVAFGVDWPKHFFLVLCGLVLGLITFLAIGAFLAAVYPSVAAATGISNGLLITLIMTSGIMVPTEVMPDGLSTVMKFSPGYHLAEIIRASWSGTSWPWVSVVVLLGVTVVFGGLGTVLFKWESTK
ncbi:MAG: ABC transporter permease [Corynebacterium sp.]|uniref:ABC transporter permease n=1 Tax=Corynebacterium sp. TaxID=1720 RepID=UPI0026DAC459|nr:ABC transporter permease [Corynebacterium sp.]MDO5097309.1 ABC transporter permease [Corynebacterium sp.]